MPVMDLKARRKVRSVEKPDDIHTSESFMSGWVRNKPVSSDLYTYIDGKNPDYTVSVNGKAIELSASDIDNAQGYAVIARKWKAGDVVTVHFDLEPRMVQANFNVKDDRGRVAIERGPVVYCAEWPDNDFDINNMIMSQRPTFSLGTLPAQGFMPNDGSAAKLTTVASQNITTITTDAQELSYNAQGLLTTKNVKLKLIPYYAWCHRGSGNMKVWLPMDVMGIININSNKNERGQNIFHD